MTSTIQKTISMRLEAKDSQLRRPPSDVDSKSPNQGITAAAEPVSKSTADKVTLSSRPADSGTAPKLKPSQPVTPAEKQALQTQFSVYA